VPESNVEVEVLRVNTKAYIDAAPTSIIISRAMWVSDGSGGRIPGTPTELEPQRVAFHAAALALPVRRTLDGIEITPEYLLLGTWDADIERGDTFFVDGVKYEVAFVQPDRSYEVRAEVVYRG
jgi:hypothetical protein